MHIKTISYSRTFKLERYLGEAYKYENLVLGCEVELEATEDSTKAFEMAKNAVKNQLKDAIKLAMESQNKQKAVK